MTVWIITEATHSCCCSTRIFGVYATRELAQEAFISAVTSTNNDMLYDPEEYVVNS